ncbi:hypothetical protein LTR67_009827 [Exophiala xenobiotica]
MIDLRCDAAISIKCHEKIRRMEGIASFHCMSPQSPPYASTPTTMSSQLINPPFVHPPRPTYTHVQTTPISPTSTLITIAGQIGIDGKSRTLPPTFSGQVQVALDNLGKCLEAVGATPADIIKVTHFVVNLDPKDNSRAEAYLKFMGDHRPPSTLLGVAALADPELLYEVEAMAIVHRK